MCSKKKTTESIENYWDRIKAAERLIRNADSIIIGAGSGLSAAGGLNYTDPKLTKRWFPQYYAMGVATIPEIQSIYRRIDDQNVLSYWGYWAKHIFHIRYETPVLQPYLDLHTLVADKHYFICSTNVDGQFAKARFPQDKTFAPQGDYALFQCSGPCSQEVYPNKTMIDAMMENIINPLEIEENAIPKCPRCGSFLIPNLRCDDSFVEKPHMERLPDYEKFVEEALKGNVVLLELGVGYNTPGIIRYPFEDIAYNASQARLIRININDPRIPREIAGNSVAIQRDIKHVLKDILNIRNISLRLGTLAGEHHRRP